MAWVKIPAEHHPLFRAAIPKDPRVSVVNMFGGVAALVNGNMFGGLFARSMLVKLSAEDQALALALDGTEPFDPMGTGRVMRDTLLLPESVMDDAEELRGWLRRALAYTATLPAKKKKNKNKQPTPTSSSKPKPKPKPKVKTKATVKTRATAKPRAKAAATAKPAAKAKRRR